ncbi:glucose 1-dehydrogenase [Nocardia jiangxiensis]|uniref:Glucose 1-dehydrogenase n=1 Tax=Nocardia jiangxiensis TaxID=282685 RepID=A0ABW6SCD2_9NOCA|nr:glucose 1-dehydrogenase [Nocardia jiangxiensis]
MESPFEGKRVLVTGGAAGFGEAIVRRFAGSGASVAIADIDEKRAENLSAGIDRSIAVAVDVSVPAQVQSMIDSTVTAFGGIDVLVNNAGVPHRKALALDLEIDEFDLQFAINVRSVFLATKYAVPHMPDGSVIVNTASIGAKRPRPTATIYNATKGAVITLTRGLATELSPRIRVNAVAPVASPTGFMKTATGLDALPPEIIAATTKGIPMGRLAEPADVASAVHFLASQDASFLTGVCLDVDGGRSIQ